MTVKKAFLIFYILIALFLIADVVSIHKLKISLAGYWSDRVLFWTWALSTLAFLIVFWKNIFTKLYLGLLLSGLVLSMIAMMIPFFAIYLGSTGLERSDFARSTDGKYRAQIINSIMARPKLQLIENRGLFEKVIAENDTEFLRNDNLKLGYENIREIRFAKETTDSLIFEVITPWRSNRVSFKR